MRKITAFESLTLAGVIQAPGIDLLADQDRLGLLDLAILTD